MYHLKYHFRQVLAQLGGEYLFTSQASSGAVLVLPMGAVSSKFYGTDGLSQWIMSKHVDRWFNFVQNFERDAPDMLYIVTGVYHAKSWALSAYINTSESSDNSRKLKISPASPDVGAGGTYDLSWEADYSDPGHVCRPEQCSPDARCNQAVFIKCLPIVKPNQPRFKKAGMLLNKLRRSKPDTHDGRGFRSTITGRMSSPPPAYSANDNSVRHK
jgi:hypothetical protein